MATDELAVDPAFAVGLVGDNFKAQGVLAMRAIRAGPQDFDDFAVVKPSR